MLENARVLLVRKIKCLGMDPSKALLAYFSKFGRVERVMVAPTRAKKLTAHDSRVRPANVGFVLMAEVGAAAAALKHGEPHVVEGRSIDVSSFESHSIDATD